MVIPAQAGTQHMVIPAQAGTQIAGQPHWIPACAGMTGMTAIARKCWRRFGGCYEERLANKDVERCVPNQAAEVRGTQKGSP
ncbi:MAG: hypothetical protein O3A00_06110 [Planctomycetota bacterium]|nr:hypothetical protein [Planctomycetota bacterium]